MKPIEVDTRGPIPAKKKAQNVTPSTDDDDETNDVQTTISTNDSLRWQIDSDEHKIAKGKLKLAGKLLDALHQDRDRRLCRRQGGLRLHQEAIRSQYGACA